MYDVLLNTVIPCLHTVIDMVPLCLNSAVKHIAKPLQGEERNLIKKGWDQLYLEPMNVDGFLENVTKC